MSTKLIVGSFLLIALLAAPSALAAPSGGACAFGICPGFVITPFGGVIVCATGTPAGCQSAGPPAPLPAPIPGGPVPCTIVSDVAGTPLPGAAGAQACL